MDLLRKRLFDAQENRAVAYQTFDAALGPLLVHGDQQAYRDAVANVTQDFQEASRSVLDVVAEIKKEMTLGEKSSVSENASMLLKLVEQLQQAEERKLNLTATMHMAKSNAYQVQVQRQLKRNLQAQARSAQGRHGEHKHGVNEAHTESVSSSSSGSADEQGEKQRELEKQVELDEEEDLVQFVSGHEDRPIFVHKDIVEMEKQVRETIDNINELMLELRIAFEDATLDE